MSVMRTLTGSIAGCLLLSAATGGCGPDWVPPVYLCALGDDPARIGALDAEATPMLLVEGDGVYHVRRLSDRPMPPDANYAVEHFGMGDGDGVYVFTAWRNALVFTDNADDTAGLRRVPAPGIGPVAGADGAPRIVLGRSVLIGPPPAAIRQTDPVGHIYHGSASRLVFDRFLVSLDSPRDDPDTYLLSARSVLPDGGEPRETVVGVRGRTGAHWVDATTDGRVLVGRTGGGFDVYDLDEHGAATRRAGIDGPPLFDGRFVDGGRFAVANDLKGGVSLHEIRDGGDGVPRVRRVDLPGVPSDSKVIGVSTTAPFFVVLTSLRHLSLWTFRDGGWRTKPIELRYPE